MFLLSRRLRSVIAVYLPLLLVAALCVPALWPEVEQAAVYHHTAWTFERGIGAVFDIQQATDGYLWITTSKGVLRFDGVRFETAEETTHEALPQGEVSSFLLGSAGGIWFSTRNAGLVYWKDNKLSTWGNRDCTPAFPSESMAEGADESLWVQAGSGLFHADGRSCKRIADFPAGILVDRDTLWVETPAGSLLSSNNVGSGFRLEQPGAGPTFNQSFLHHAPDGSIWLSDQHGLRRVTDSSGQPIYPTSNGSKHLLNSRFGDFAFSQTGSLWSPGNKGLELIPNVVPRTGSPIGRSPADQRFTADQGFALDSVRKVFIDREGSIWVGTNSGLHQLRKAAFASVTLPSALETQFAISAGDNGSVWFGSASLPLTHLMKDGKRRVFPEAGQISCIRRDYRGAIWVAGRGKANLWRYSSGRLMPLHFDDEQKASITSIALDPNHDTWISTLWPEIFQAVKGRWEKRNQSLARPSGYLGAMTSDESGIVWIAFPETLIRWDGSNYERFTTPAGMPWILVTTLAARSEHVWLGGQGGLQFFMHGDFHTVRFRDSKLPGRVSGVLESEAGDLWINGFSGVTYVRAAEVQRWIQNPAGFMNAEQLDASDGLPGLSVERYPEPSLTESSDHRLWFATSKGIASLDLRAFEQERNPLPPTVEIGSVTADGKEYAAASGFALPPHQQSIQIDYTALSLAVPERVRFRYKLEGVDRDWNDVGTRRQAYYTRLAPRSYHFRVIACNNDGVWNDIGATLNFRVLPAWYETEVFGLMCVAATLLLLLVIHRIRVHQLSTALALRFEERLNERTRLARDLHDSLLGTIQACKWLADGALHPSGRPEQTRNAMPQLSQWLGQAIQEGREALHALRASSTEGNDLAGSFREFLRDCPQSALVQVHLSVCGLTRAMHPIVRDEIFRVGSEALRNAFRHSSATRIEVLLEYSHDFTLRIRDNGKGFHPDTSGPGRDGHFGMQGMRERTERIGGKLMFGDVHGLGATVTLVVPGTIAFGKVGLKGDSLSIDPTSSKPRNFSL